MGSRTVRLDDDSEKILAEIVRAKKLSVSEALKQGLLVLRDVLQAEGPAAVPYSVYRSLDLGRGGYAHGPARRSKRTIRQLLKRKTRR